ncbi:hypothetical protein DE146DRAFT_733390 [Phaeosphaeria sp. MPI-PUGE-AT-0046c]|nr:hypothetical protein DE146DRAFT_733390 [Phaeosphaeria sp. MPI-PUGE-AT-0046c]
MDDHTPRFPHRENSSPRHVDLRDGSPQVGGAADQILQAQGAKRVPAPSALPRIFSQQQCQHQAPSHRSTQAGCHQHDQEPKNAVTDILPYCTTEPPLTQEQVIALSDVAGSVKELALLALGALAGDRASMETLNAAVESTAANNIIDFFTGEWEVDG